MESKSKLGFSALSLFLALPVQAQELMAHAASPVASTPSGPAGQGGHTVPTWFVGPVPLAIALAALAVAIAAMLRSRSNSVRIDQLGDRLIDMKIDQRVDQRLDQLTVKHG